MSVAENEYQIDRKSQRLSLIFFEEDHSGKLKKAILLEMLNPTYICIEIFEFETDDIDVIYRAKMTMSTHH